MGTSRSFDGFRGHRLGDTQTRKRVDGNCAQLQLCVFGAFIITRQLSYVDVPFRHRPSRNRGDCPATKLIGWTSHFSGRQQFRTIRPDCEKRRKALVKLENVGFDGFIDLSVGYHNVCERRQMWKELNLFLSH
jgi:hypothetical protein